MAESAEQSPPALSFQQQSVTKPHVSKLESEFQCKADEVVARCINQVFHWAKWH